MLNLLSANAFNLDKAKICCLVNNIALGPLDQEKICTLRPFSNKRIFSSNEAYDKSFQTCLAPILTPGVSTGNLGRDLTDIIASQILYP